jgi:hypothetical protein
LDYTLFLPLYASTVNDYTAEVDRSRGASEQSSL